MIVNGHGPVKVERSESRAGFHHDHHFAGAGEVLGKFGAGGICGSDLHYFHEGGISDFKVREGALRLSS